MRLSLAVAVALLLAVVMLPTMISWGPGATLIGTIGSWAIPGRIQLDSVSCGWFTQLSVTGLRINEPDGGEVIALEQASVSRGGLMRLAMGGRALGDVVVAGLRVTLEHYADGSNSFERAFGPSDPDAPDEPVFIPPSLRAALTVQNAEFHVRGPNVSPVIVSFTSSAAIEGGRRLTASLDASVMRDVEAGRIQASLEATDFADADGLLMLAATTFDVQTQVQQMDLAAVDQMLGQNALLTTLLGPSLELRFDATGTLVRPTWQFEAASEWLTATGGAGYDDEALVSEPGTRVQFRLTPAAWARLMQPTDDGRAMVLAEPVDLQLALNRLWIADTSGQWPGLHDAEIDLRLTATGMHLVRTGEEGAGITLADIRAGITSEALGAAINLHAAANVRHREHQGQVSVTSTVQDLFAADDQPQLHRARVQGRADVSNLPLTALEALAGSGGGAASSYIGSTLNGTGQLAVQPRTSAETSGAAAEPAWALNGDMQLATDQLDLHGHLVGDMTTTRLNLTPATGVQLDIAPTLLTTLLGPPSEAPVALHVPLVLNLHVDRAAIAWHDEVATSAAIRLTASDIPLRFAHLRDELTLRDFEIRLDEIDPTAAIRATLGGHLDIGDDRATLAGQVDLSPAGDTSASSDVAGEVTLAALPTRLIIDAAGLEGLPPRLIDPALDAIKLSFSTNLTDPIRKARFATSITAASFDVSLAGAVTEDMRVELEPGVIARYRIAPAVLQQLLQPQPTDEAQISADADPLSNMQVDKPVQFVLTLDEAAVGIAQDRDAGVSADLTRLALALRFVIHDASMTDVTTQRQLALRDFAFALTTTGLADHVSLTGGFELTDTANSDASGRITTRTTITNLLDPQMQLRTHAFTVDSQTQATLPLGMVDAALDQGSRLVEALGDHVQFNLHMRRSPGEPVAAGLTLTTPEAVDIQLAVTQPASAQPCDWTLTAQAKPLLIDVEAHGAFDPLAAELTLERYESRTLVASRQITGTLAALPRSFTDQLETHGVAIAASLRMRDGRFPLRAWRESELDLLFNADAMVAYYQGKLVPIDRALVRFSLGDRVASLDHFAINAMRGNLTLTGLTSLADEHYESAYQLRLHNLDANSAIALVYPPDTLAGRTQGTINGEVRLHGPLSLITAQAGGGGEIQVADGVLAPLPVISDILQFLHVNNVLKQAGLDLGRGQAPAKGDDTARVTFDFIGNGARFNTIDVVTKVAKITGDGTVGFDESLNLNLVAELLTSWIKRPVKVTGTINEPEVDAFGSSIN